MAIIGNRFAWDPDTKALPVLTQHPLFNFLFPENMAIIGNQFAWDPDTKALPVLT